MAEPSGPQQTVRREQLKGLLWALPVWGGAVVLGRLLGSFSENPWGVAAVLLPLAGVVWYLGRPLVRDRRLVLGGGFLTFFLCYCLFFAVAAGTDLLNGKRTRLAGYEDATPPNFLGLSRLGDWHYWLAPDAPAAHDLLIVTLPSFAGEQAMVPRRIHAGLIRTAIEREAKGLAFDYFLQGTSPVDGSLCFWLRKAAEAQLPVLFGYRLAEEDGVLVRRPLPETLRRCIPEDNLASLTGYRESDGRVRMVPLYVQGDHSRKALSLKVAERLPRRSEHLPEVELLQFTQPRDSISTLVGPQISDADREKFRDRFVLVGSYRPGDRHVTPFGELEGVRIHAYAAQSLRAGHLIRRIGRAWIFPIIFALCYLLIVLQARSGGRRSLLAGAALLSLAVVICAALAMRIGLVWVDVSYPLTAVWGLSGLMLGGAALQRGRLQATVPARPIAEPTSQAEGVPEVVAEPFDVFLSHNGRDKPAVRLVALELRKCNLGVWLDEWELVPGRPWQEAIEEVILTVRSAAVLVGADGLGPWEEPEMRACLDQCVKRRMPVIPVLLPGAPETPDLPLFLRQHTWVDLRGGIDQVGLDRLVWGITGIKPRAGK